VFWVHGSTKARFEEAYRAIADRLELPGRHDPKVSVLQLIRDWLCDEANGRWMMVLDNVDNVEVFYPQPNRGQDPKSEHLLDISSPLAAYLPQSHNGSILITSRNRDAASRLTGSYKNVKEVQAMDQGQALQLLRNKLEDTLNEDGTADLLHALNHIPLAITQAAAYINRRGSRTTISSYLDEFRKNDRKKAKLLKEDAGDLRRDERAFSSVITTWQISFKQIREERRSAADLLSLMSFFNPQGIPESVLRCHDRNAAEVDDKEDDEADADSEFDDDLETLRAYSLVTATAETDMCEMHQLVQFCMRIWLSSIGDVERWRQKFCRLMSREFPVGEFENWPKCQKLLPHVEPLFSYEPADKGLPREWARVLTNAAWYMWMKGSYQAAEDTVLKAIKARERMLGREDPDTLMSVSILALVLQYKGKYEEAESMNRRALEGREKVLGKEHPSTLASVDNLALVLRYQGKYEEAEPMSRRALERTEKALGKEHPNTLMSVNNLALVLLVQGKYEEAESMNRRALDGNEKALGKEHPNTLASFNNLALVLRYQGKYEEAETMNRRALEGYEKALGKEHPDTLASTNNLAIVLRDQGKYEEAESMHRRELKSCEKALRKEHPDTLTSINNLALVLGYQGKYEEAETMNRRALKGREKALGKEHPGTLTSVNNLAMVLRDQGKYEEAETMNRRALKGREKALGKEHPDTLKSAYCLAYLYHQKKQYDTASELYQRACDAYKRILGPQHPITVACCNDYSRMEGEIDQSTR
jgi:tetratricopeptide (TPR) repeat protein